LLAEASCAAAVSTSRTSNQHTASKSPSAVTGADMAAAIEGGILTPLLLLLLLHLGMILTSSSTVSVRRNELGLKVVSPYINPWETTS
jgi:hypothetical protein